MKKIISLISICLILFGYPINLYASEQTAIFAGGCFWCLEHDLQSLLGVVNVESGYSGGDLINPTYRNHPGYQEVVRVTFETNEISFDELLRAYWRNIDPLDNGGQFCDRGESYIPIIFTSDDTQKDLAIKSIEYASRELKLNPKEIKVKVQNRNKFWLAENYHQDYADLNKLKYKFYRYSCGRDERLKEIWGDKATSSTPWI